jgi:hypothetical protein
MALFQSCPNLNAMLGMSDADLASIDPLVMNLTVAQGIPALANLNIAAYVSLINRWSASLSRKMEVHESEFRKSPQDWNNDVALFRLGVVCWFIDVVLGIVYREDQRYLTRVRYTNPADLFLNGVMDTRQGTCASLAQLHVVLARRMGLPVSLACVGSHFICRYDDGERTINIETTNPGSGGFSSQTDDYILKKHNVPAKAQACGSDLRAVSPREMLGIFLGLRARHLENTHRMLEAEQDYLLARSLFPHSRQLYIAQNQVSVQRSMHRFEPEETGHPTELAKWLQEVVRQRPWERKSVANPPSMERENAGDVTALF